MNEYHHKLPVFYAEYGHPLEDEELDEFVYGYPISQTASHCHAGIKWSCNDNVIQITN